MMTMYGGMSILMWLGTTLLFFGIIFSLPMIWYHVGHISRKLDKVIDLLKQNERG